MKKYIFRLLAAGMMLCAVSASAQFRYGATAGVVMSDLKFNQDLITVDKAIGATAGVVGELMFPGIGFGIDLGLLYTMRGAEINLGEREIWASQGYGKEQSRLHYIDIPVNLRFKYTRLGGIEEYVAPFIFGGPSVSFLVAKSDIKALEYPGADIGLSAGFGLELFKRWQVSASYTWGITYSLKTRLLEDFSAKNKTLNIRLTYFFD